MMAFVWTMHDLELSGRDHRYLALVVTIVAALLMVSRLRYFSFKAFPRSDRVPFLAMLVALAVFVALAIDPPRVLLLVAVVYAVSGPLYWLWQRRARARSAD